MSSFLVDSHTHVYLPQFDADRANVMANATAAGVTKLYLPAVDSTTHEVMLQTEARFPVCKSMMGLHPCSVKDDYEKELAIVRDYLEQRRFVAVGEIGLDFYWDKTFTQQQYDAFQRQIGWALEYSLPVSIHSRNATDECIEVVSQYPLLRGVFHCFSGNEEQARKLIELDFMLGIGGVVTFKNSGLDKVVEGVGLSHLILETDAPYLAPVPHRGKRNEPAYTKQIAEKLAALYNRPLEEVAQATTQNAEKLFAINENA